MKSTGIVRKVDERSHQLLIELRRTGGIEVKTLWKSYVDYDHIVSSLVYDSPAYSAVNVYDDVSTLLGKNAA